MAEHFQHDPGEVRRILFERAQGFWAIAQGCRLLGFIVGIMAVATSILPEYAPIGVLVIALAGEGSQWRSDTLKGKAEGLARKIDRRDAFGWPLSGTEMTDFITLVPPKRRAAIRREGQGDAYFASQAERGAVRALENVRESAWWSQRIADGCRWWCWSLTAALAFIALVVLLVSVQAVSALSTRAEVGRVVTAILTFTFSFGLVRLAIGYGNFANAAAVAVTTTERELGDHAAITDSDDAERKRADIGPAIRAQVEYHVARAGSPLFPSFYYKRRKDELNALWDSYLGGARDTPR